MEKPHFKQVRRFCGDAVAPTLRKIRDFAEQEIIVPQGPMAGRPYRVRTKPASALWFDEIDSGRWLRHIYTGPTQSGKTLDAFVIPIAWCLFERREDVIVGVPDLNMSSSKWQKDILPVIERTRYSKYLPKSGAGSRGGEIRDIRFGNGTWLTFMSFGGRDKSKAGETAPNIIITETDGANSVSETSEEGTAIDQIQARADAFDDSAFLVAECTVSTDQGITWTEYENGTASRIVRPCPHCHEYVAPERQHFIGWELASTEMEARDGGRFHCPSCKTPWTDDERFKANQNSRLIHKGQSISREGEVSGADPKTFTLGFRTTAIDNPFRTSASLATRCYRASRARDQEAARRTLLQSQFTEPIRSYDEETPQVDPYEAAKRKGPKDLATPVGVVPLDYELVTVGVDLRATQLHWVAIAWKTDGTCRIINYDIVKVFSRKMGLEAALITALRYLRDNILEAGFVGQDGQTYPVEFCFIDAGYQGATVYNFIRESWRKDEWYKVIWPYLGRGQGKQYVGRYTQKTKPVGDTLIVGTEFHCQFFQKHGVAAMEINADFYKTFVHNRLRTPIEDDEGELVPGAMTLFVKGDGDHSQFMLQLCAENERHEFDEKKGEYTVWITVSRVNHFFDATYSACCAAVFAGVRTIEVQEPRSQDNEQDKDTDDFDDYEPSPYH